MLFQSIVRLKTLVVGLVFIIALIGGNFAASAQEDSNGRSLKVGDLIEFEFLGKTYQSTITKFTGTGWPYVEFEYNGAMKERFFPDSRVTLVSSSDDMKGASGIKSEMRTWTDATGSFSVKAKMISSKNGKVELEKDDGRVITLPANKLSAEDQAYIKKAEKALADEMNEDNPFAGGEQPGRRSGGGKTATGNSEATLIEPEYDLNGIVLAGSGSGFSPDPAIGTSASKKVIKFSTGIKGKYEFHNKVGSPTFGPGGKVAATTITNPFVKKKSEVILINMDSGESKPPIEIPIEDAKILGVSGDGSIVATLKEGRGSKTGRLDFWTLSGGKANNALSWKTKGFHDRDGFEPKSGRFVGPSRLLTFGKRVILWDCETAAALYSFPLSRSSKPIASPGGNQLAIPDGDTVYIVNIKDGSVLGTIDVPEGKVDNVAFSQNGQYLAGVASAAGEIWVWDIGSGDVLRQFSSQGGSARSIQWCGNKYVLVNNTDLMDVELRAVVWKYSVTGGTIINSPNGGSWFVGKSKLTPIQLPHKNLDAQTAKYDPEELLILKPGTEVSIKLNVSFPPSEQREIREKLTAALEAKDVIVKDGAEMELVATVKRLPSETVEVSSFFDPIGRRGTEKISFTPSVGSLNLMKDGTKIWGKGRHFGPQGVIHSRGDESTQQAANRLCIPSSGFFTSTKFPRFMAQLPSGKPLGNSKISEQGVR